MFHYFKQMRKPLSNSFGNVPPTPSSCFLFNQNNKEDPPPGKKQKHVNQRVCFYWQ